MPRSADSSGWKVSHELDVVLCLEGHGGRVQICCLPRSWQERVLATQAVPLPTERIGWYGPPHLPSTPGLGPGCSDRKPPEGPQAGLAHGGTQYGQVPQLTLGTPSPGGAPHSAWGPRPPPARAGKPSCSPHQQDCRSGAPARMGLPCLGWSWAVGGQAAASRTAPWSPGRGMTSEGGHSGPPNAEVRDQLLCPACPRNSQFQATPGSEPSRCWQSPPPRPGPTGKAGSEGSSTGMSPDRLGALSLEPLLLPREWGGEPLPPLWLALAPAVKLAAWGWMWAQRTAPWPQKVGWWAHEAWVTSDPLRRLTGPGMAPESWGPDGGPKAQVGTGQGAATPPPGWGGPQESPHRTRAPGT